LNIGATYTQNGTLFISNLAIFVGGRSKNIFVPNVR